MADLKKGAYGAGIGVVLGGLVGWMWPKKHRRHVGRTHRALIGAGVAGVAGGGVGAFVETDSVMSLFQGKKKPELPQAASKSQAKKG